MHLLLRMLDGGEYEITFEGVTYRSALDAVKVVLRAETGRGPLIEAEYQLNETDDVHTQVLICVPRRPDLLPQFVVDLERYLHHYGAVGAATTDQVHV